MATTIYSEQPSYGSWIFLTASSGVYAEVGVIYRYPYPECGVVGKGFLQKCVDTVTGLWVVWETETPDVHGIEYPGEGFDFATYRIEAVTYGRQQL